MKNQVNSLQKEAFGTAQEQLDEAICQACLQGIEQGVFPGVTAAYSLRGQHRLWQGFFAGGLTRLGAWGRAVGQDTLFDLASLSKALCTTLLCLHLIDQGKLSMEDRAFDLLALPTSPNKKNIRIRHLLRHASGLPAYKPFFRSQSPGLINKQTYKNLVLEEIAAQELEFPPGSRSLYSDLGFIVLGAVVEKIARAPLDWLFHHVVAEPIGLGNTLLFRPLTARHDLKKTSIAATEYCPWRKKIIQGEVDDEHCWLMGGVAGHAGLFGTVGAVLTLCERLLDIWHERATHPAFGAALLQEAWSSREEGSEWALGFDRPSPGRSSSGRYFSANSLGHLGFSGTSFWIDPEKNCIVVLLSNRIHPTRDNAQIKLFRPFFHDCIMKKITAILERKYLI